MDIFNAFNSTPKFIPKPNVSLNVGDSAYPYKHSGVVAVVGTHPCWAEDYLAFSNKYPQHDIIAINEAGHLVPAHHLITAHDENLQKFVDIHQEKWGYVPVLHVTESNLTNNGLDKYIWPISAGGGSAVQAAAIAIKMGYEQAILCGCPLNGGGGYPFKTHSGNIFDPRIGSVNSSHAMIKCWHNQMKEMKTKNPEIACRISSMSGVTKEIFGGIDDNQH